MAVIFFVKSEGVNIATETSNNIRVNRPCGFRVPVEVEIQCHDIVIPGTAISLPLVRLSLNPLSDDAPAILHLSGGPGQGANTSENSAHYWAQWLQDAKIPYELVLIDTRANFGTAGYWACPEYESLSIAIAGETPSSLEEYQRLDGVVETCLKQYNQHLIESGYPQGLTSINSREVVRDLRVLFDSFPHKQWHVWGVSYGSRLSLLLSRDARVKSVVLDSVYPLDKGLLSEWPGILKSSFETHERLYARKGYGDFASTYEQARQSLLDKPMQFNALTWDANETIEFSLTPSRLDALQFFALYDEIMIDDFHQALMKLPENTDYLINLVDIFVSSNFDKEFNTLLFWAVECQDNSRVSEQTYRSFFPSSSYSALQDEALMLEWQFDVCRLPIFSNSPVAAEPVELKVPTLVIAGEHDPITPSSWATEIAAKSESIQLIKVEGAGHAVLASRPCLWPALVQFWQGASVSVDRECIVENLQQAEQ
jgi:pimeloyl-ACP methyl ester carboxylesterase